MTAEKKKRSKARGASDPVIPDKLYFRIGEVAGLCRLPAYVLRFWETEFPQLKPVKSSTGQRMYRQRDVENVLRIKLSLIHIFFRGRRLTHGRVGVRLGFAPGPGATLAPSRGNAELGQKPLRQHYVGNQNQDYWDPARHASITLHPPA